MLFFFLLIGQRLNLKIRILAWKCPNWLYVRKWFKFNVHLCVQSSNTKKGTVGGPYTDPEDPGTLGQVVLNLWANINFVSNYSLRLYMKIRIHGRCAVCPVGCVKQCKNFIFKLYIGFAVSAGLQGELTNHPQNRVLK